MQQKHYSMLKIEPIEYIRKNNLGFLEGNVIKYLSRYPFKNGIEDLEKAKQYLEWLIEDLHLLTSRKTPVITVENYCKENKFNPLIFIIFENIQNRKLKICFKYINRLITELESKQKTI